jgi:hypothetical protein
MNQNMSSNHGIVRLNGRMCGHIDLLKCHMIVTSRADAAASDLQCFSVDINALHVSVGSD